jgi:hypothetical protein
MEGSRNPEFLKEKYGLHNEPDVKVAAEYANLHAEEGDEEISATDAPALIQNYLDRYTGIFERKDPEKRDRGIRAVKRLLTREYVIKPEEIPEGYFELQKRLAREQGHGDIEITPEMREQLTEVVIADQESSLNKWIDYLGSPDATYPDWLKYYAIRSITGLGEYDKEKKQFTKRSSGTVKPFPDLDREALAYVLDAMEKKYSVEGVDLSKLEAEDRDKFTKLLQGENFGKLYAWAIEKVTPASQEAFANTKGVWKKYDHGSDHMPLVESLQGHGTGWCTAGESTAQTQLSNGDFYVYYSEDKDGKTIIPRAAIRMEGDNIGEVRGVAANQNLDPFIGSVVAEKMKEFPDGAAYEKKAGDMKRLTTLEKKTALGQQLAQDDLIFLYELKSPIQGFGYDRDPRIAELRDKRNKEEDAPIVFGCAKEQIARSVKEVKPGTKAYVGPLEPGIFDKLPESIEHIYTKFPEGKIERIRMMVGGKSVQEYEQEMDKENRRIINENDKFKIGDWAKQILPKVKTSKQSQETEIIRLSVADLGFNKATRYDELCKKAKELGLELCPAEAGLALRLELKDQPIGDYFRVAMEPLTDSDGDLNLFDVDRGEGGRWLYAYDGGPHRQWDPEDSFVFVRGKH